ncbi:unnamed protein product [Nezara viridula]|uniref:Transporter n=1 Tax=Nezara viridula TaxID=85310 RepID=A0A9P0HRT7_NEZVI|nr:unnamed protein product [Nezara viridula]
MSAPSTPLVGMGCSDGKRLVIRRVGTSPSELLNIVPQNEGSPDSLSMNEEEDDDDPGSRGSWDNKLQFILACVGCSVGLGSLWRFPYLAYTSGGGSFLVPYYLIRLICGIPLLYMELAIGQFTRRGPIGTFSKLCPLFKGAGLASVVVAFFMSTYYNMIIAYAIFYFFSAFRSKLPWEDCSNRWNTKLCWPTHHANMTKPAHSESPAEEFFIGKLLKQSHGIEELGSVRWELAACLLFAWIIVYFALWKSVRSSGRVLYFTATLPFILVLAFLGRSLTLEGADVGLDFLFKPSWHLLKDSKVWIYAAAQNFNSIGIAYGGVITFASYNTEKNKILPDTLLISAINDIACMIIAVFSFATIGNISTEHQTSIDKAISDSPGLVFVVYSTAMSKMPFSSFWAVLFFFMLLCLGLNTQFAIVEVVVTSIQDGFPNWIKKKVLCHELLVFAVCCVSFILGFPLVTQGGIFFFQLIDHYAVCNSIVYIAFFEVIAVSWFYGAGRLATNIERMSGEKTNFYFKFCWVFGAPTLIFFVWLFGILDYTGLSLDNGYHFPTWANVAGWCITAACLLCIPIILVYVTMLAEGKNFFKKLCNAMKPRIEDIPPPIKETEIKEMKTLMKPIIRVKSNSLDHIVIK